MAGLTTPRIRVLLAPHADADPGVDEPIEHQVRALNMDMVAFDRERARYKWPDAQSAPMLWATFIAYRAVRRMGIAKDMTMAQFEAAAWQIEIIDDESTEDDAVDPTRTGPEPD